MLKSVSTRISLIPLPPQVLIEVAARHAVALSPPRGQTRLDLIAVAWHWEVCAAPSLIASTAVAMLVNSRWDDILASDWPNDGSDARQAGRVAELEVDHRIIRTHLDQYLIEFAWPRRQTHFIAAPLEGSPKGAREDRVVLDDNQAPHLATSGSIKRMAAPPPSRLAISSDPPSWRATLLARNSRGLRGPLAEQAPGTSQLAFVKPGRGEMAFQPIIVHARFQLPSAGDASAAFQAGSRSLEHAGRQRFASGQGHRKPHGTRSMGVDPTNRPRFR